MIAPVLMPVTIWNSGRAPDYAGVTLLQNLVGQSKPPPERNWRLVSPVAGGGDRWHLGVRGKLLRQRMAGRSRDTATQYRERQRYDGNASRANLRRSPCQDELPNRRSTSHSPPRY